MRVPILTYHSLKIHGNDYANNDLVALAADVEHITHAGFRILPLHEVIGHWLRKSTALDGERVVVLTCDDGADFDARELLHPSAGAQPSVLGILRDFQRRNPGAQPDLFMTSFAIVSPDARAILDRTCLAGTRWWNEDWWQEAVDTGLMGIASHSWDHNHDTLEEGRFPGVKRGTFTTIDNEELADFQIAQASRYLAKLARNPSAAVFGYPYGETNDFLTRDYLPRRGAQLGLDAAVSDGARPLTEGDSRWQIPRYVFERDWKSPDGLQKILDDAT